MKINVDFSNDIKTIYELSDLFYNDSRIRLFVLTLQQIYRFPFYAIVLKIKYHIKIFFSVTLKIFDRY